METQEDDLAAVLNVKEPKDVLLFEVKTVIGGDLVRAHLSQLMDMKARLEMKNWMIRVIPYLLYVGPFGVKKIQVDGQEA